MKNIFVLFLCFQTALCSVENVLHALQVGNDANSATPDKQYLLQRPGAPSIRTVVNVSLFLVHIQGIDEQNGHASMTFYIELTWFDPRMQWDWKNSPEYLLYTNVSECYFIDSERIWTPKDISFGYNVISATAPSAISDLAHVCWDGSVTTNKLQQFSFSSYFENYEFPFDTQQIETSFGSPFAGLQEIDVRTNIHSDKDYPLYNWWVTPNAEWNLESLNCSRTELRYPKSRAYKIYPLIQCVFTIARSGTQYIIFFCVPSVVVTFIGLLGIFCNSSNTKDAKIQLALMNLMVLSVLSMSLSAGMPLSPLEDTITPRTHRFYLCQMTVIAVGSIFSCVLSKIESMGLLGKKGKLKCLRMFVYLLVNLGLVGSVIIFIS